MPRDFFVWPAISTDWESLGPALVGGARGAPGAQRLGMEAAHSAASLSIGVTNGGLWLTFLRHNVSSL